MNHTKTWLFSVHFKFNNETF